MPGLSSLKVSLTCLGTAKDIERKRSSGLKNLLTSCLLYGRLYVLVCLTEDVRLVLFEVLAVCLEEERNVYVAHAHRPVRLFVGIDPAGCQGAKLRNILKNSLSVRKIASQEYGKLRSKVFSSWLYPPYLTVISAVFSYFPSLLSS